MGFPVPLPGFCRVFGKRKWEVSGTRRPRCRFRGRDVDNVRRSGPTVLRGQCSAAGEAVSVGGFDDDAGSGHGGEALVEGGGANAAGSAQFGEWPGFACVGERCSDALIDGSLLDGGFGLGIGLDGLQGEGVIALGEFESDAGMAAAARCSTVRTMRSLLSRRR